MAQMETDAQGVMARMERGLHAGAEVLKKALQDETKTAFKAPSGELATKVKESRKLHRVGTECSVEVYAQGSYKGVRGKPRLATEVAFVQEYGRGEGVVFKRNKRLNRRQGQHGSKTQGTLWNANAVEKSSDAVGEAISREMFRK